MPNFKENCLSQNCLTSRRSTYLKIAYVKVKNQKSAYLKYFQTQSKSAYHQIIHCSCVPSSRDCCIRKDFNPLWIWVASKPFQPIVNWAFKKYFNPLSIWVAPEIISTHCELSLQKICQPLWIWFASVAQSQWPPFVWQHRFKAIIWFPPFIKSPVLFTVAKYTIPTPLFTIKFEN